MDHVFIEQLLHPWGFPSGTSGKEPAHQHRRHRFDPWVRKIPGGGHGNPLQYSCLENATDRGAWQAIVIGLQRVRHNRSDITQHSTAYWSLGQRSKKDRERPCPLEFTSSWKKTRGRKQRIITKSNYRWETEREYKRAGAREANLDSGAKRCYLRQTLGTQEDHPMWNSGTVGKGNCKVQGEGSTEDEGLVRGQVM